MDADFIRDGTRRFGAAVRCADGGKRNSAPHAKKTADDRAGKRNGAAAPKSAGKGGALISGGTIFPNMRRMPFPVTARGDGRAALLRRKAKLFLLIWRHAALLYPF